MSCPTKEARVQRVQGFVRALDHDTRPPPPPPECQKKNAHRLLPASLWRQEVEAAVAENEETKKQDTLGGCWAEVLGISRPVWELGRDLDWEVRIEACHAEPESLSPGHPIFATALATGL